jgi:hypothetical protein
VAACCLYRAVEQPLLGALLLSRKETAMSHLIARPAARLTSSTTRSMMHLRAGLAPIALLGLLSACAGSAGNGQRTAESPGYGPSQGTPGNTGYAAPAGESYGEASAADSYGEAPSADYGGGGSAPSQAPSRSSATPSARGQAMEGGVLEGEPSPYRPEQPRERPGLGTVFGESRASAVRTAPFVRASSQPFAAVALHYNDLEGVRAHTQYRGQDWLAPYHAYTSGRGLSVALVDEYGNILQGGTTGDRNFIIGQEGQRYEIIVQNQTGGRFEVVTSVDGLDVIDGLPAHFEKRGYVIEPHGVLRIEGWRRSHSEVASFRFGRVSDSYAARTTGDRNVGVIGLAFFAERGSPWTTDELQRRDTADPFPAQSGYAQPPQY